MFAWLPLLLWTRLWRFLSLFTGSFDTISNRLLGWEIICVQIRFTLTLKSYMLKFHLNWSAETVCETRRMLPCSRWTPRGGEPARKRRWSSYRLDQGKLWPGRSRHYAPPCPKEAGKCNGCFLLYLKSSFHWLTSLGAEIYLSEHNVKWKDLKEEVWGNGQNLLLFLVLLHDVAVGGVIEIQPAQNWNQHVSTSYYLCNIDIYGS